MASEIESTHHETLQEFPKFDLAEFNSRHPQQPLPPALELISYYGNSTSSETQPGTEEVSEQPVRPAVRDNGLGLMVIDTPEASPALKAVQKSNEEAVEQPAISPESKARRLPLEGLKRVVNNLRYIPGSIMAASLTRGIEMKRETEEHTSQPTEIYSEKRRNWKRPAIALGSLALAGVAIYTASKTGIHFPSSGHSHEALQQAVPAKVPHQTNEAIQNHHLASAAKTAVQHKSAISHQIAHQLPAHRVESLNHPGDTIYNHVHQRVLAKYHNLSQEKIKEYTDKFSLMTVKLNHLSNWQVHHMRIGQKFKDLSWLS